MGSRIGKNKFVVYWEVEDFKKGWNEYRSFREAVAAYRRMTKNGIKCGIAQVVADDGEEI